MCCSNHWILFPDWFPWCLNRLTDLVCHGLNLTRFHGVFAPNSKYRALVTPARRGKNSKCHSADEADQTAAEKRASMTWAKRLKQWVSIWILKLAPTAVVRSGSLPVLKIRQSFRRYSPTWATWQVVQQQHGYRIAGRRQAC